MESYHRDAVEWAGRIAARLRVLMVNASDEDPEVRRKSVLDELSGALKGVASSDRPAFLAALEARFPGWDAAGVAVAGNRAGDGTEPKPDETPRALVERLVQAVKPVAPEAKRELDEQLAAAGLGVRSERSGACGLEAEPAAALGLRPGEVVSPERLAALVSAIVQPLLSIDQLMQGLRQQLTAPAGGQRRPAGSAELKEAIRKYLSGEPNARIEPIEQVVRQCAKTVARLLHVVGGAGRDFARKHHPRFAPSEIRESAELERGYGNIEQKCWRLYVRVAEEFWTEAAIEREIQDAVTTRLRDFTSV